MLLAGRALMLDRGYRPSTTKGHVAVVNFLHATLGTGTSGRLIIVMNGMRKKRHRIIYEEMDIVSKDEAEQAVRWAEEFVNRVDKLIDRTKSLNGRRMNTSKSA